MRTRREFLASAAMIPALALSRTAGSGRAVHPLGIQFFTFGALATGGWEGFSRAMQTAQEIGYVSLELAGLMGQSVDPIRSRAKELGLALHSFHMGNDQVRAARLPGETIQDVQDRIYTPEGVVEVARVNLPIARALGCTWGVVAAAGRSNFANRAKVLRLCDAFNEAGKMARAMSMELSYHMHPRDFETVDGISPFDLMIQNTDTAIRFQVDVCWAAAAGINPADLINTHSARIVSLHLKDLAANRTESATAGDGVLDFDAIRRAATRLKSPLFYVERDGGPNIDPVAEARKAFQFLTTHGW
jgi:sugar phosphate isomerase/epimerase